MSDRINTARLDTVTNLAGLNDKQMDAVRKLRRFAESQNVSPYTVGILCQRDTLLLERLSDGKRYSKLSPASRELLIAEVRELLEPYEPSVVAVYSAWCKQHDVNPDHYSLAEPEVRAVLRIAPEPHELKSGSTLQAALAKKAQRDTNTDHPSATPKDVQFMALRDLADEYRVGVSTLARWAMMTSPAGPSKRLPDRESDDGIELAECVFQICLPKTPEGVARRKYRKRA